MFHVTPAGDVRPCKASKTACRYGKAEESRHFDSEAEARAWSEAQLELEASHEPLKKHPEEIKLGSQFGEYVGRNGDLSEQMARLSLVSGLCGSLALAIHRESGASIYITTFDSNLTEEKLAEDFAKDPAAIYRTPHMLVESPATPGEFLDAYGRKTFEEIDEHWGGVSMVKASPAMAEYFSREDSPDLTLFARAALELDKNEESYPYEDWSFDDLEDEEDFEDELEE